MIIHDMVRDWIDRAPTARTNFYSASLKLVTSFLHGSELRTSFGITGHLADKRDVYDICHVQHG